jgi:hypothetical protein
MIGRAHEIISLFKGYPFRVSFSIYPIYLPNLVKTPEIIPFNPVLTIYWTIRLLSLKILGYVSLKVIFIY